MFKEEIKNQIIKLRENGVSYNKIANITKTRRAVVTKLCKHIKLTDQQRYSLRHQCGYQWSHEEIEFLKKYYSLYGPKYCANKLNIKDKYICKKAMSLGVRFKISAEDSNRQKIIKRISNNKVLCKCKKHGIVMHYDNRPGHSYRCSLCSQKVSKDFHKTEKGKEFRRKQTLRIQNDPKLNLIHKIRGRLNGSYHGRQVHFTDLGYTGEKLKEHFDKIKKEQNNKCPGCYRDYGEVGFTIDHIIPLSSGNSRQEIINLSQLSNLSLLCKSCNSSKNDNNYQNWCNNKGINLDNESVSIMDSND